MCLENDPVFASQFAADHAGKTITAWKCLLVEGEHLISPYMKMCYLPGENWAVGCERGISQDEKVSEGIHVYAERAEALQHWHYDNRAVVPIQCRVEDLRGAQRSSSGDSTKPQQLVFRKVVITPQDYAKAIRRGRQ